MKRELVGVFLALSLTGCAVIDATRVRQMSSLELQEAFQPCVSPLGVSREHAGFWPEADASQPNGLARRQLAA